MSYPTTGQEVYVSLNLSNTMLTGIGKGTITREEVSASYLKRLFAEHGVIVSAKPEQRRILEIVNERYDLELNIPESLKLFQLSEEHRRLVVVEVTGSAPQERLPAAGVLRGGVQRGHLRLCEVLCAGHPLRYAGGGEQEAEVRAGAGAGVAQPRGQLSLTHTKEGDASRLPLLCGLQQPQHQTVYRAGGGAEHDDPARPR